MIVEVFKCYDYFYGISFKVECLIGFGNLMCFWDVFMEFFCCLVFVFFLDEFGYRFCYGSEEWYVIDEDWN